MRRKKLLTKATAVMLAVAMVVTLTTGVDASAATKNKVSLSKTKIQINQGKTKTVKVKAAKKTKVKKVKWTISKGKKIVKLTKKSKSGVTIKGLKKGSATVVAKITVKGQKKAITKKIKVTVKKAATKTNSSNTATATATPTAPAQTTNTPAQPTTAPTPTPDNTKDTTADFSAQSFDMEDVVVTDSYYANSLEKEIAYMEELDENKLLAGFKETAGYAAEMTAAEVNTYMGTTHYKGGNNWEDSLIGGHTLGHYMTALAQAVSNPETSADDKAKLQKKIDTIVSTLKECQEKTKGSSKCKEGYLFGATLVNKTNMEQQFDNVEKNLTNIGTQAWVPWYTMHKILAGLVSIYELTGNKDALAVAENLGEWTYNRVSKWSASTRNTVLNIEYGGMNDTLYELALCTSNATYQDHFLKAAAQFDETTLFEKVKKGSTNVLNNLHANTTIPKFLGALNRYVSLSKLGKLTDSDKVYLEYAEKFWDMVVNKHTYITGGLSEWEHFGQDCVLDSERTNCNNETCCTYNMLKMSRMLFEITGDKKYSDYYEKTLINAIIGSQNPETGMSMYFQPMKSGYFKVYSSKTQDFWCCTGSGMENFTKLNDSIYFYKDNNIYVNQYRSSTLTWKEKNAVLVQDADLLTGATQNFEVKAANGTGDVDVNVMFRIPDYAKSDLVIKVNGTAYSYKKVNGYAQVSGKFASGTKITVEIPMQVTYENLTDSTDAKATDVYGFKYGPFVLAADLGTDGTSASDIGETGVTVDIPKATILDSEILSVNAGDGDIQEWLKDINTYMEKTVSDGTVSFKMTGTDKEYTFVPYYSLYGHCYGIYWNFTTDASAIALSKKTSARAAKQLDSVQPGYGQNESDEKHALVESDTESQTANGSSRWTNEGGCFSYRMSVSTEADTTLICQYKKADNGKTVKITLGDYVIAEETLNYTGDKDIYEVYYNIPKEQAAANLDTEYTADKVARIQFSGVDGAASAEWINEIYTYKKIGTQAELTSIETKTGTLTEEDGAYKIVVPSDTTSVDVTFNLKDTNGYITIDGAAVDDSKAQSIDLKSLRVVKAKLRVYAEDFQTYKDYSLTIQKEYPIDESIEYFVDCGDFNVSTVSDGDKFGVRNSVTEQVYGKDPITGYQWGIVDTISNPLKNGTSDKTEDAIYTDNTWPHENDVAITKDGMPKTMTNRYTKNQVENGIAVRFLDYAFELENGDYTVEVGFRNPWSCSTNPILYSDYGTDNQKTLSSVSGASVPLNGNTVVKGTVTVTNGKLTLNARSLANASDTRAINMTYIIIKKAN